MPFCFLVDSFYYPEGTPREFLDPLDIVGMQKWLGGALTERVSPPVVARGYGSVRYSLSPPVDGIEVEEWVGSTGTISRRYRSTTGGRFFEQRGIVDAGGYETLIEVNEDVRFEVDRDGVDGTRKRLADIGEDGIVYSVGPSSPIMDLLRSWVDLDRFVYDFYDHPDLIERLLDTMARANYREYELLAASTPAKVIVFWDCVNSVHVSADWFRRYIIPVYRTCADICHAHDKILVCHTCGRIAAFLEMFLETGVDAIDWLTPPDTGDVVFSEAQALWKGRIGIMGTLVPSVVRFGSPDALEAHIYEVLRGVDTRNGFVFQAPIPGETPMVNVNRILEIVEDLQRRPAYA